MLLVCGPGVSMKILNTHPANSLAVSLLDSATWAVPRFAPFIRMAVAHAVRRGLAEAVLRHWRRVADPADVLAGQGAPPDPGVLPLPPLPIAAIPLPDGMAAPLAAFGAVPVGLFG